MAISIHALREEGDLLIVYALTRGRYFYPRPPRGGRLGWTKSYCSMILFLSTPSARRATRNQIQQGFCATQFLSTPSARRATEPDAAGLLRNAISIHALREEGDGTRCSRASAQRNFYPRPPRGGRHFCLRGGYHEKEISIHALREEGDVTTLNYPKIIRKFLSTPSARRATAPFGGLMEVLDISIHALREEGDSSP